MRANCNFDTVFRGGVTMATSSSSSSPSSTISSALAPDIIEQLLRQHSSPVQRLGLLILLGVYAAGFFMRLTATLSQYPLFPLQSVEPGVNRWHQEWLVTTVADYYGACLPLVVVIVFVEPNRVVGFGFAAAICLLGCPFACLWMMRKIIQAQPTAGWTRVLQQPM